VVDDRAGEVVGGEVGLEGEGLADAERSVTGEALVGSASQARSKARRS